MVLVARQIESFFTAILCLLIVSLFLLLATRRNGVLALCRGACEGDILEMPLDVRAGKVIVVFRLSPYFCILSDDGNMGLDTPLTSSLVRPVSRYFYDNSTLREGLLKRVSHVYSFCCGESGGWGGCEISQVSMRIYRTSFSKTKYLPACAQRECRCAAHNRVTLPYIGINSTVSTVRSSIPSILETATGLKFSCSIYFRENRPC